jgi:hypothetical protein
MVTPKKRYKVSNECGEFYWYLTNYIYIYIYITNLTNNNIELNLNLLRCWQGEMRKSFLGWYH